MFLYSDFALVPSHGYHANHSKFHSEFSKRLASSQRSSYMREIKTFN